MKKDQNVNKITFSGTVNRCVYDTPDFKIYALNVDTNLYPFVKRNKYGGVTILGELFDLSPNATYEFTGVEQETKYGYSYKVTEMRRNVPKTSGDIISFLSEIININQAYTLFEHYPDIIDRVRENRYDDIDFKKLKGIKEKTFARIVSKITENFCLFDLIIEFKGYLTLNMIKKLYAEYESVSKLKHHLQKNPYKSLCSIAGIGFVKADALLLEIEKASKACVAKGEPPIISFKYDLKTSLERCTACLTYLLMKNQEDGNTKMNLADLRSMCLKTVPDCADHFVNAVKSDDIYYNKETMDVSMRYIYNEERYIANKIINSFGCGQQWTCDTEKYREVNGAMLSDEQLQVLTNVCEHPISILNGAAGCGKSFSMKAVIHMLDDLNKSYVLLAPTGKASKILAAFTNRQASTIHRGLKYMPNPLGSPWGINAQHPFSEDIIIIDEFSMVDVSLFKHVMDAIDFNHTKLLMIGDNAQLPSVSCGNLLHDFMMSKKIPTVTLTKVFRYGEGGLMKIATDVRNCKKYLNSSMKSNVTIFGNNKDYAFIDTPSDLIPKRAVSIYKNLLLEGNSIENIQVLTAKNVGECGTITLNNMIQKIANPYCGNSNGFTSGEVTYYKGDLVIQKANNYRAPLSLDHLSEEELLYYDEADETPTAFIANGESGIVQEVANSYMIIKFDDMYVQYTKAETQDIGLGYAISIHKSQGSSIDNVIICSPESHIFMSNSNLLYVGLTRMRKRCYHIGSLNTVNMAVQKKANLTRHTFMQQFLTELKPSEVANTSGDENNLPWFSDEELKENPNFFGNL